MLLNDEQILKAGIISPALHYSERYSIGPVNYPIISRGMSSFGYDITLAPELKAFRLPSMSDSKTVIDPKAFDPACLVDLTLRTDPERGDYFIMGPHSYALGRSVERFIMPLDTFGICVGKSTYARIGLVVNTTPLEPGWNGYLTLEFANTTPWPIKVYPNEGVAQVFFLTGDFPEITYAARNGKYQNQGPEIVTARV